MGGAEANPELSIVVIGLNEGRHLRACLESVRAADLQNIPHELIYVDGGSDDDSVSIARDAGVDLLLGGDRRRRAAENRNLGLQAARGRYVQFLDGDMVLQPGWPREALAVLETHPEVAVVTGMLQERRQTLIYRALQLDWRQPEGEILYCGGAAMFRGKVLLAAGGFPEDVAYGEEPLLCWHIRNQHQGRIYHLPRPMVLHDLAYTGFRDYWRRNVRVGETYAEIAARLQDTHEPFWSPEVRQNLRWFLTLLALGLVIIAGLCMGGAAGTAVAAFVLLLLAALLLRKTFQKRREGWGTAFVYALHTYCAKLGIGWGVLRWKTRSEWLRPS